MLTNVINRPTSESQGCAIYIGPTRVDFSMLGVCDYAKASAGQAVPPAPHIARLRYDPWKRTTPKGWQPLPKNCVPRVLDMTGRKPGEQLSFERQWQRDHERFLESTRSSH